MEIIKSIKQKAPCIDFLDADKYRSRMVEFYKRLPAYRYLGRELPLALIYNL